MTYRINGEPDDVREIRMLRAENERLTSLLIQLEGVVRARRGYPFTKLDSVSLAQWFAAVLVGALGTFLGMWLLS